MVQNETQHETQALLGALSALKFTGKVVVRDDGAIEASCGSTPVRITLAKAGAAGEVAAHIERPDGRESRPFPSSQRGLASLAARIQAICDAAVAAEGRAKLAAEWSEALAPLAEALGELPFQLGVTATVQPSGHLEVTIVTRDLSHALRSLQDAVDRHARETEEPLSVEESIGRMAVEDYRAQVRGG
jgi:hypothetical protein